MKIGNHIIVYDKDGELQFEKLGIIHGGFTYVSLSSDFNGSVTYESLEDAMERVEICKNNNGENFYYMEDVNPENMKIMVIALKEIEQD